MVEIIPAILARDYEDLKNKISLLRGVVPMVQIDICDGNFVPNITWPFLDGDFDQHFKNILNEQEGVPFWEDIDFEFDLMVSNVAENFDIYLKLGPRRVVFHLEAFADLDQLQEFLEGIDPYVRDVTEIGVAIGTNTDVEKVFKIVNSVDFVQCMGIENIGFQGQEFDERVLEQIQKLRAEFPDLVIS